ALQVIDAWRPAEPRSAPPVLTFGLLGPTVLRVHQPIHVEQAVQMIELVLHDTREPAAGLDLEPLAIDVLRPQQRPRRSPESKPLTREGEAPLYLILARQAGLEWCNPKLRVDRHPAFGRFVLLRIDPHEQALTNAYLR